MATLPRNFPRNANKQIDFLYLTGSANSVYIVLEETNHVWDLQDVLEFDRMWKQGLSIKDIARSFDRDTDEVGLLVMDRAKKGHIVPRQGGLYGRQKS